GASSTTIRLSPSAERRRSRPSRTQTFAGSLGGEILALTNQLAISACIVGSASRSRAPPPDPKGRNAARIFAMCRWELYPPSRTCSGLPCLEIAGQSPCVNTRHAELRELLHVVGNGRARRAASGRYRMLTDNRLAVS